MAGHDVIAVGAGLTGLVATKELADAEKKFCCLIRNLKLHSEDRLGGHLGGRLSFFRTGKLHVHLQPNYTKCQHKKAMILTKRVITFFRVRKASEFFLNK